MMLVVFLLDSIAQLPNNWKIGLSGFAMLALCPSALKPRTIESRCTSKIVLELEGFLIEVESKQQGFSIGMRGGWLIPEGFKVVN